MKNGLRPSRLSVVTAVLTILLAGCSPVDGPGATDDAAATTGAVDTTAPADTTAPGDTAGTTAASGDSQELVIATGGTGGVYFPLGGGLAEIITDNVPGYSATSQETNASVDNMLLIDAGEADIAFTLADTAADAVNGEGEFTAALEACALARIYNNATQLVTSADSGIATVADLAGRSVSLGSPGSGTEVIALRILEAAGIDPDSGIERQQLGIDETVAALRDGTIDAGFWSGGLPTGALVDYATTGDMLIVPTGEYTQDLVDAYGPFYVEDEIPAESYQGQSEAVSTISVPNLLVANPSMPEALQQQITEALFEFKDDLVQVHPAAEALDSEVGGDIEFMDICPGSAAYYGG